MLTTSVVNVCDEREWCTVYGTPNWVLIYFNSVIKRVKQCCCTLILLPKSTLNANWTTINRFFTNDDWQRGRFENFESDHQYESNHESDVRFEIESNRITKLRKSLLTGSKRNDRQLTSARCWIDFSWLNWARVMEWCQTGEACPGTGRVTVV